MPLVNAYIRKTLRLKQAAYLLIAMFLVQAVFAVTVLASDVITSAAEIDYPPFSIVTDDGQADGFSVELLRAALNAMGRDVTFHTGTWPDVRALLETGEIQALPLVGRTPEREPLFDFTFPYMSLHGAIVVRADTDHIHTLEDLRGSKAAVMKGDNAEEFLRREDRGIDIFTTDTFEQALRGLQDGDYDAVVIQRLVALRLLQETGLSTLRIINRPIENFRQDFSFAVKEGDRDTLALLNEGLALVIADGTYQRLHAKWFAELQLPAKQRLIVGGDVNFPPYEYLDKKGKPTGFITELTRAIAVETGLDIEIRLGPWDEVVKQLVAGDIDIIQGMFYSSKRSRQFDFGFSHLTSHYVSAVRQGELIAPESYAELAGLRLVAQRGDVIVEKLQEQGLTAQLTLVNSQEEALQLLLEGRQDCALVTRLPALAMIEENNWTELQLGRSSLLERQYSVAVQKGQRALLAKLNEGLQAIQTNGEYRRIHDKWLAQYQQPHSLWVAIRYSAIILIPLVVTLLAIFLWSWSLRRQVAYQTRQIREDQLRLQAITNTAQDAILMMNSRGEVVFSNPAVRKVLGYEAQEILGQNMHSFIRFEEFLETNRDAIASAKKKAAETDTSPVFELTTRHKDGHKIYIELSLGQVLLKEGKHEVGVIRDITQRKQAQFALEQKNQELEEFVHIVSHDLKSPLVTVKSFVSILRQDLLNTDQSQISNDLKYIDKAADKMGQLLDALLQYSRIGRSDTSAQTLSAGQSLDDCLAALAGILQKHKVQVLTSELPQLLCGDPMHFGQIWQNLIENAVKYRGDQAQLNIKIGATQEGPDVVFYVRDNGMGIEPKHNERIFNLFSKLNPNSDGTGLGLALVKKIVSAYQGRIWVESEGKSKGSCFYFTLPGAVNQHEVIK
jgi:two-component system sensor histidine kinase EvgS